LTGVHLHFSESRVDRIMARMEVLGAKGDWCFQSRWMSEQKEALGMNPNDRVPGEMDLIGGRSENECNASKVFLEETLWPDSVARTYRCTVQGHDVELRYSVALSEVDDRHLTKCTYAVSTSSSFDGNKRYTGPWAYPDTNPGDVGSEPRERPRY
jgi:hypothetical protein